jgi:DNA-binding XRE family transcriptional regulator
MVRGSEHSKAKLTEDDVRYIRNYYFQKEVTQTALAQKFGVSAQTINGIIKGREWRHVL